MSVDAWLGIIGTLLGAVVGWSLTEGSRALAERRRARRDIAGAAFVCLDRLLKIHSAIGSTDDEQRDSETYRLGADLDRYRDCIATAGARRSAHWRVYRRAMPILLHHEFEGIGELINEFERVVSVNDD